MAHVALRVTLVAATLATSSALLLQREPASVLSTMPAYSPDPHAAALMQREDAGVEVYELANGRVSVLRDPWWVGNRQLRLVTVETRPNMTKARRIMNVGLGKRWTGYITKLRVMADWLSSQARDPGLVIFVDGEDVLFGGCSAEQFLQDYYDIVNRSNGVELVIGAERGCYECPIPCKNMPQVPGWAWRNWKLAGRGRLMRKSVLDPTGQMRFLNSGFIVGPVEQLSVFFRNALESMELRPDFAGDQYFLTEQFVKHPNSAVLDYSSSLVTSLYSLNTSKLFQILPRRGLYNRVTEKQQCFIHANGPSRHTEDVNNLISWLKGGPPPW